MWRTVPLAAMLLMGNSVGMATPDETEPSLPDALYAIPTRIDRIGRIVVPVEVNCRGPFKFILDTGANATVLSEHLAAELNLKVDPTQMVTMRGVTGSAVVPTAALDRLETGDLVLMKQRVAVADASLYGADGLMGMNGFKDKLVLVDFMHDRISVLDARAHRPSPALERIPARMQFDSLLMIDAIIGSHKVKAIVDTGAQRTLGNRALYAKLGLRPTESGRVIDVEVIGATEGRRFGERHVLREVALGGLRATNLTVTFGDFYIFKIWKLESQPALVIGMDMVGTLDTFGIDYFRHEVQMRVVRGGGTGARRGRGAAPEGERIGTAGCRQSTAPAEGR